MIPGTVSVGGWSFGSQSSFKDLYRDILKAIIDDGMHEFATKGALRELVGVVYTLGGALQQDPIPHMRKIGRNYMHEIFEQLPPIVELLKSKPTTKNAWINVINTQRDKDYPCIGAVQVFLRQNALHLMVVSRSSDIWNMFPFDVASLLMLREKIAKSVGEELVPSWRDGQLIHLLGSAHIYEEDLNEAEQFVRGQ